ncbi:MAG TPA: hypothetical protein VJV03_14080 [Pyrinomonadaceae bacterium]|nr:hypothetical protein [Pyrinomonadaceae bacterium]
MKGLLVIVVCLLGIDLSPAQDTTTTHTSHGVVILELTWSRKVSKPNTDSVPREEPSGGLRSNPDGKLRTAPPIPPNRFPYRMKLPYFYVYSLKVKNAGLKKIRGVVWEYVTTDPVNGAELGRRRVINHQELRRGEVTNLRVEYPSPPTNVVTAEGLGDDERAPFKSSAEIKCVLYADATVWEVGGAEGEACAELLRVDAKVRESKEKRP